MSRRRSTGRLLVDQIVYQLKVFWRVPVAVFFTVLFPLMVLVIANAVFGSGEITTSAGEWSVKQFYTGGLAAFTAVSATYTNLANMVPIRRDEGILKRWRGTPLPTWICIGGWIGSAVVIAAVGTTIMLGVGVLAYDLQVEAAKLPGAVVTFLVGVAAFAALGMAVAALIPRASAASAVANATLLPLAFVSNVFIPLDENTPAWLETLGDIFPLKPFVESFQDSFNPLVEAPAIDWPRLAYIAAWGVVGMVVAVRWFRWEPSLGGSTRRRRAASAEPATS